MITRYLISYYDRSASCRQYYLNRSSFETTEQAEREVRLLKIQEAKKPYKNRIRFKIEPRYHERLLNIDIK